MNYKISFKERAEIAKETLSRQRFITLAEAKKQALHLKEMSTQKNKKQIYLKHS